MMLKFLLLVKHIVDLGSDIDICVGEQTYLTPTVTGGSGPLLTVGAPVSLVRQLSLEVAIYSNGYRC